MANAVWQATITDQSGNVLPGAEVEVVNEATGLSAPLFATRTGTSKSNPFFADANGFAQFYAAPGLYRITATSAGTGTTITWRNVRLVDVATNAEALAGAAGVLPDAAGVKSAFGQFGVGSVCRVTSAPDLNASFPQETAFFRWSSGTANAPVGAGEGLYVARSPGFFDGHRLLFGFETNRAWLQARRQATDEFLAAVELLTTGNTTVDGNGFIKQASPIISLYSDHIESNGDAALVGATFDRVGTGHYVIGGVPELSRDGWYIETPKDRNGNVYFTLDYEEVEGALIIRTYGPDYSTGRAENGAPVDILAGRFVSLRFAEAEPVPEDNAE